MSKQISQLERAALLFSGRASKPPKGAFTLSEYARFQKMGETSARRHLQQIIESGQMESGKFLIASGHWVSYFWFK